MVPSTPCQRIGGAYTARYAEMACGFELTKDKCPVIYTGCNQAHQGGNSYAGCENKTIYEQVPNRIPCNKT